MKKLLELNNITIKTESSNFVHSLRRMGRSNRTIFVGNLPGDIRESEVEDLFYKYGRILDIDMKISPRPPGYAFVEFEDSHNADDAIRGRDDYDFDGYRLHVELADRGRGQSSYDRYSTHSSGSSRGGVSRRTDYRVLVTGLPSSASWQDLKDHMRQAGDVCFSEVFRDRDGMRGIVDYTNYADMKYAIRKLDDSLFRNQFSRAYIRVEEYDNRRSYSRSPSRSPYPRSRSPSHSSGYRGRSRSGSSRSRSRSVVSRSRSRSRTPASSPHRRRGVSASPVRSPSRSRIPSRSESHSFSAVHNRNQRIANNEEVIRTEQYYHQGESSNRNARRTVSNNLTHVQGATSSSHQQLNQSDIVTVEEEEISTATTFTCPICMDQMVEETSTKCGHVFCRSCITFALLQHPKCPMCRRNIGINDTFRIYLRSNI